MLIHFPIVFWAVAAVAYGLAAAGASESIVLIAKFANGAGLIAAMLAMVAGLLELRFIDMSSEAMRVATQHMMVMATVWLCFLLALLLSISTGLERSSAQLAAGACAGAGFVLMGVGGWLGGRLVYEFGIAVKTRRDDR